MDRKDLNRGWHLQGITRRAFGVSFGAGMGLLAMPVSSNAALKKVPTATGIDALFAPFVPFFDPRMGRPSTPMET